MWEGIAPANRSEALRRYRDERLMIVRHGKPARDILWVGAKPSDYAKACDAPAALTRFLAAALAGLVMVMRSAWRTGIDWLSLAAITRCRLEQRARPAMPATAVLVASLDACPGAPALQ